MASAALVRAAGLLEDETGLHALSLSVVLLDEIGPEYLLWESEALRQELEEKFGVIGVGTWEKIQALRILHVHDAYWREWEVFEKVTAALMGEVPVFSLTQPPEAEEIAISLSIAERVDKHDFDEDVRGYIVASCLNDGLWYFEAPIESVVGDALAEHDRRYEIERDFGSVAAELQKSDKFRETSDDPISQQTNRVLEVRLVLKRYSDAVEQQLRQLPEMIKRSKK